MQWGMTLLSTLVILMMSFYLWSHIESHDRKMKTVFAVIMLMGWILSIWVINSPRLLPSETIDRLHNPIKSITRER